ncbi:hypothetical protein ACUOA8_42400, partial [Escherichia sp. SS-MK2]
VTGISCTHTYPFGTMYAGRIQAVVLLQEEKQELHAYFTSSDIATIDIEEVYNHTARILPAYMVPLSLIFLQEIYFLRIHFLLVAPGQNLALKTRMGQNHLDDVQQC